MAYRSRSARRLVKRSRRNFTVTLFLIAFLVYVTIQWLLPSLITGLGIITNIVKPSQKQSAQKLENASLAPPILNIPFEATNTAQIDIRGYGTADSKVSIYLDNKLVDTVNVASDGSFEAKNISLSLGTNEIFGKSVDPDFVGVDEEDRESLPSKTFKIIYDNETPELSISEPEDGKKIQGGDRKIRISGNTEIGAQIFLNEGQIIVDKDGNFSSEQSLNDGDNNFNIKAVDKATNATEVSRIVTYQP